ncbi:succinyldiaminopimelate transaminase [Marinagarivorans algicola]|uniref:succinyldiaminopimelate transaminase n=1 Tax=Marinagarivorans algicola TaxID=1513270 RepID=UPI0006B64880|nr:succinyldiaminopimelate transaminase [Marinagarivorans algicola]
MNPALNALQPYPFEKLAALKAGITPPAHLEHIALSIGEPKHTPPDFALEAISSNLKALTQYPSTKGLPELRSTISRWASARFHLQHTLDSDSQVLPVAGTREALFAFTQAVIDRTQKAPKVLMPNPFYQIYEGAAILAGAEPVFLDCTAHNGFLPDLDSVSPSTWQDCQLLFLCSPGNPTGTVMSEAYLAKALDLAEQYDFIIASDECYSELYFDEEHPPIGLLQACSHSGRHNFKRAVVFHSLSKRSNLPGLRSGFIAGDADILATFLKYRTYHGCALSIPTQLASIAAWQDEAHVKANRDLYRQKFTQVTRILNPVLPVTIPQASFYLWPQTPINDTDFAQGLFAQQNITVLPGQYLARTGVAGNPGAGHIRMALVAPVVQCIEAAQRIKDFIESL